MIWLNNHGVKVFFIFAIILFAQPYNVLAVEGTCSWHSGVNCNAMADWDGSAVCNDGWRDSTEYYYQMQECESGHHYCTQTESNQISKKFSLDEKNQSITNVQSQITALQSDTYEEIINAQNTGETSSFANALIAEIQRQYNIEYVYLNTLLQSAKTSYWNAWNQATSECFALGDAAYLKLLSNHASQLNAQPQPTPSISQYSCPSNLILKGDKCYCNDGYAWYGNLCIPMIDYCHAKYGINSIDNNQGCICADGFAWNIAQTSCDKIVKVSSTQSLKPEVHIQEESQFELKSVALQKTIPIEVKKNIEMVEIITASATTSLDTFGTSTNPSTVEATAKVEDHDLTQKSALTITKKPSLWNYIKNFFIKLKFW